MYASKLSRILASVKRLNKRESVVAMSTVRIQGKDINYFQSKLSVAYQMQRLFLSSVKTKSVTMPSLSPTMSQGTISAWRKSPGDALSPGDILCDIETDKATVGFEVQDDGVLAKILAESGVEMLCGVPIAITVDDEAEYKAFLASGGATTELPKATADIVAPAADVPSLPSTKTGPVRLSPAARHMVESSSLDVSQVTGTSRGGLLSKADVVLAVKSGLAKPFPASGTASPTAVPTPASAHAPVPASVPAPSGLSAPVTPAAVVAPSSAVTAVSAAAAITGYTDVANNKMRKIIAKRLTESKAKVPHSFYTATVEIDALMAHRAALKAELNAVVSVNDLVIKAAALALRDVPQANGSYSGAGGAWVCNGPVDISVAVATPSGLITPIITGADKRGLLDINATVKALAGRARDGKLKPEEFQGGTFTISNLGMFGISEFSAVINAPQGCILAVGSGVPRVLPPRAGSGATRPRVATTLSVTLSADRRVLDEAMAAQFMQALSVYIGNPKALSI